MEKSKFFDFMPVPKRTAKPRTSGLTMVEGDYMCAVAGMNWLRDLAQWGGDYIDYFKVGHPMMFQAKDLVLQKLALLKQHDMKPYIGGNTTEAVIKQRRLDEFLDELAHLGIQTMEVSSTVSAMKLDEKTAAIQRAKQRGFTVFAEVGKKLIGAGGPKGTMPLSQVIDEMKACLSAGAVKVVYEHTEIENLQSEETARNLSEVAGSVGADNIMFEVPIVQWKESSPYAALFIENFGPNVNIGDVDPKHVLMLEALRNGLTHRTFGKVTPA
jgi:phosphosulfolactate synthase